MGWGEISSILNLPSFSLLTSHSNLNTKNLKILPSHTQQCLNPKVKVLFPHQACAGREKFLQAGVRAWPPSNTLCFLTHCLSPAASWLWHIAQPSSWSLNKATCQHCTLTALYKKNIWKAKVTSWAGSMNPRTQAQLLCTSESRYFYPASLELQRVHLLHHCSSEITDIKQSLLLQDWPLLDSRTSY